MDTNFRYVHVINQILGFLQHSVSSCSMYVWTERNKDFVFCSDFVGYGNNLSNILAFLFSYTELIILTAPELAIGFLEVFCYRFSRYRK